MEEKGGKKSIRRPKLLWGLKERKAAKSKLKRILFLAASCNIITKLSANKKAIQFVV